jgi:hypothetical protein
MRAVNGWMARVGSRVALKPRHPVSSRWGKRKSIPVGHLDLRETVNVHHLVLLDNAIFVPQAVSAYRHVSLSKRTAVTAAPFHQLGR